MVRYGNKYEGIEWCDAEIDMRPTNGAMLWELDQLGTVRPSQLTLAIEQRHRLSAAREGCAQGVGS